MRSALAKLFLGQQKQAIRAKASPTSVFRPKTPMPGFLDHAQIAARKPNFPPAPPGRGYRPPSPGPSGRASRSRAASDGRSAARQIREVRSVKDAQALGGRGLNTMKLHKVRTGMVVGAGMSVAAAMRNTGPATSSGSQSLYRH